MIEVILATTVLLALVFIFWRIYRKDRTYSRLIGAKILPRKFYAQFLFIPKPLPEIFLFEKHSFDNFVCLPDKLYRYRQGFFALWRHFGSGGGHSDQYVTVILLKISNQQLRGHIRCLRLFESSDNYQRIANKYFTCLYAETNSKAYCDTEYLQKLSKITEQWTVSGWNFVFIDGYLAVYFNGKILTADEIKCVFNLLTDTRA